MGFELASGIRVNFHKSNLIGVNVDLFFFSLVDNFLHCKIEFLSFKYLGILVGGRVTLFKHVLNVIHVFLLSFLKKHVKVWKKFVRIQRIFLWRGVKGDSKISWVRWSDVCESKKADLVLLDK
ncbi:unnamed protein product [Lathyrus sativus]|nr:unnamed protein product [Lathyrus sativus]